MRAVDTNVLVRLIVRDDPEQVAAAEEYIARGVWVSHVVLIETVWVLADTYKFSDAAIAAIIDNLLAEHRTAIQDPDVVAAALELYRRKPALGFTDCLVLETARKAGHLPVGTFDKQLSRFDGAERLG